MMNVRAGKGPMSLPQRLFPPIPPDADDDRSPPTPASAAPANPTSYDTIMISQMDRDCRRAVEQPEHSMPVS